MSKKKDMAALVAWVSRQPGWSVARTGKDHTKLQGPPGTPLIFAPLTPSGADTLANLRAKLRRAGLDVPR